MTERDSLLTVSRRNSVMRSRNGEGLGSWEVQAAHNKGYEQGRKIERSRLLAFFGWRFHQQLGHEHMRRPENFSSKKMSLWSVGNGSWLAPERFPERRRRCWQPLKIRYGHFTVGVVGIFPLDSFGWFFSPKSRRWKKNDAPWNLLSEEEPSMLSSSWPRFGVVGYRERRWQVHILDQKISKGCFSVGAAFFV